MTYRKFISGVFKGVLGISLALILFSLIVAMAQIICLLIAGLMVLHSA